MDKENLLSLLNAHKVDYIIIGATAFPVHGWARATLDIDIFIRQTRDNAEKTWKALKEFGYDITDVTVDDLVQKKLLIRQYIVELDVHPFVKGADFESSWKHKVAGKFGAVDVFYASLEDLIQMKEAAGRPKDQEDLKVLKKLLEKKKE